MALTPLQRVSYVGEAPFLLVTFLWALAKKIDPPTAEVFDLKIEN